MKNKTGKNELKCFSFEWFHGGGRNGKCGINEKKLERESEKDVHLFLSFFSDSDY